MRILRQKISIPGREGGPLWRRPRLDKLLGVHRSLLVIAPAGFGKTMWISHALADQAMAWLTFEPEDADLDRFLGHAIASLQVALPDFRTVAQEMLPQVHDMFGARATLEALIADLDEQLVSPITWVLDGYHQVATPSLDELVQRLWKYLPRTVRLVILTRREPDFPFRQRIAAGELTLVTETDLALDLEEARIWAPALSEVELVQRLGETGGMPAAWSMPDDALEALLDHSLRELSSPRATELLAQLSWLEGLPAGDLVAVLDVAGQGAPFAELSRSRLVRLDADGVLSVVEPYRQALRRRKGILTARSESQEVSDGLAQQLWKTGHASTALDLWMHAGKLETAVSSLESVAEAWLREGHLERLDRAFLRLGAASRTPRLTLAQGELLRQRGEYEAARHTLAYADQICAELDLASEAARARVRLGMIEAACGHSALARSWLERTRELAVDDPRTAMDIRNLEGGLHLLGGHPRAAIPELEASLDLARRVDDSSAAARAMHNLAVARTQLGLYQAALETYDRLFAVYPVRGTPGFWMADVNRALVLMHLGRWSEAIEAAEKVLASIELFHGRREKGYALRTLSYGRMHLGQHLSARLALDEAELLAREDGDTLALGYTYHYRVELALAERDLSLACTYHDELVRLLGDFTQQIPEFLLTRVRLARATGDETQARNWLALLRRHAENQEATGVLEWLETNVGSLETPEQTTVTVTGQEPELVIRCLGTFQVLRRGCELLDRDWQSARARYLFAYLLHTPEGALKEQLLEAVYPEGPGSFGPLDTSLTRIRKALEPDLEKGQASRYLLRSSGRYSFNRQIPFELDTLHFEEAIRKMRSRAGAEACSHARDALALYKGEFLPGVNMVWALALSKKYRDLALEACQFLLDHSVDDREAWQWIDRAIAIDPLDETFNREAVLRHLEADDRHKAREHLDLYTRRYREILGADPPSELRDLVSETRVRRP